MTAPMPIASSRRKLLVAGAVLGFALGGFADGILLHQVLQWHHLLSLVEGEAFRDIRVQILADGLFHVAMYAIAAIGLWLLWRARAGVEGERSDLRLAGAAWLGFALWQFVDVVLFHWVLRIHRIRVDVPDPLVWDIGWLVVLGLPPLALGWWLMRRAGTQPPGGPGGPGGRAAPVTLALAVIVAGPVAALPPPGVNTAIVLFRPGAGAFAAIAASDARILWADPSGSMLAVDLGPSGDARPLYRGGAWLVSRSAALAGCLAWSRS